MTVPNDIFKTMAPVSYDAARPKIQNGDIALFSGKNGFGPVIEEFTDSPFCHVGFIWRMDDIDRIMLLESVEVVGVRMLPLSSKVTGGLSGKPFDGNILVARHADFPSPDSDGFLDKFRDMTEFAVDRLGCPYDPVEIAAIAMQIGAGMLNLEFPEHLKPTNAYICSAYADICYRKIGIEIARARPDFIAPADFARDPKVSAIAAIAPPAA
jgi:hypothetical protein